MRERLNEEVKRAMKAREAERLTTLRLVTAAIKNLDIAHDVEGKGAPTEQDLAGLLQKMVKQREDSAAQFDKAGRPELADKERREIAILAEFLPKPMTEAEVDLAIGEAIAATGATGIKDMGRVVAQLKANYPGRIDFGKASGRVKAALGG